MNKTGKMNDFQHLNVVQLQAFIESLSAERYTPAGVLVRDLVLHHQSTQLEADLSRQVHLTIKAVAFDEIAYQLRSVDLQATYLFQGFLATKGQTKQVVLHITKIEQLSSKDH